MADLTQAREWRRAAAGVGIFLGLLTLSVMWKTGRPRTLTPDPALGEFKTNTPYLGEEMLPALPAPDFTLMDQNGDFYRLASRRGRWVLLTFAYTSCPDVCPALFSAFQEVGRDPGMAKHLARDLDLVMITLDPKTDTPERLREVTAAFKGRWRFLTGTEAALESLWHDYKIFRKKTGGYRIDHTGMVYLVSPQGLIRFRYPGTPPAKVLIHDLERMVGHDK